MQIKCGLRVAAYDMKSACLHSTQLHQERSLEKLYAPQSDAHKRKIETGNLVTTRVDHYH